MIIILTGGTGLIGKALGQKLSDLGHTLHVLTRSPQQKMTYPCKTFFWDSSEKLALKAFPESPDNNWGVIHLAGESIASWPWTVRRKKMIYESRISSTKNLVSALNNSPNPPEFFISASAIGIYPDRKDETYVESSPLSKSSSLFLENVCKHWEQEALNLNSSSRILILRFGMILSNAGGGLIPYLRAAQRRFSFWSFFKPLWINWIHIQDVINVIIWTIKNKESKGIYNVTSPHPVTLNSFSKHLQENLGNKYFIPLPVFLFKFFGGEMAKNLLTHSKVLPEKLNKEKDLFSYPSLKEALKNII